MQVPDAFFYSLDLHRLMESGQTPATMYCLQRGRLIESAGIPSLARPCLCRVAAVRTRQSLLVKVAKACHVLGNHFQGFSCSRRQPTALLQAIVSPTFSCRQSLQFVTTTCAVHCAPLCSKNKAKSRNPR